MFQWGREFESDSGNLSSSRGPSQIDFGNSCRTVEESHSDGLVSRLKAQGIDVDAATQQGTYIQLDVNKTFSTFMLNDMPDPARFFPVAGASLRQQPKPRGNRTTALWCVEKVPLSCGLKVGPMLRFGLNNCGTR
jgi:hypothetical protein